MDGESGRLLLSQNGDSRELIASTTKIMTALVVLQRCRLSEIVRIKPEDTGIEGSSIYLHKDEKVTVETLLYGLLLESGNDAAAALARYTAGSIEKFAGLMNREAEKLGMENTHFVNPHGLDADGHYSTAADLAILMRAAMENEDFARISGTKTITFDERTFKNHNRLLWTCDGVCGGKTGYTLHAGRILVTCCRRDGMSLICVTIDDRSDWRDHTALYGWAFSRLCRTELFSAGHVFRSVPIIAGTSDSVSIFPADDLTVTSLKDDEVTWKAELPRFLYAPLQDGEAVGKLTAYVNGAPAAETELLCKTGVPEDANQRLDFWEKLKRSLLNL